MPYSEFNILILNTEFTIRYSKKDVGIIHKIENSHSGKDRF